MNVSIVIHNLNRASALEACLASVAPQGYRPLSVLVLDAGSTDSSLTVARNALRRLGEVGIRGHLEEVQPAGVAASRNLGAGLTSGELICFIDNDAVFDAHDAIERLVDRFNSDPGLGLVHFRALAGDTAELDPFAWVHRRPARAWSSRAFKSFTFAGTGFAIRRDAFLQAGGFWEYIQYSREEEDLGFALVDQGYEIWYVPEITIRHYFDPSGRVGLRDRRALEYRNGVLVFWRRLPLPLAVPAILMRTLTVSARAVREDRRLPTRLIFDLVTAARQWRARKLRRDPVGYRTAFRYMLLHFSA